MLSSPAEVKIARRVLQTIADHRHPIRADALALRLWAGPRTGMRPLKDIAKKIIEAENLKTYAPRMDRKTHPVENAADS